MVVLEQSKRHEKVRLAVPLGVARAGRLELSQKFPGTVRVARISVVRFAQHSNSGANHRAVMRTYPPDSILRRAQVETITGLKKSSIYNLMSVRSAYFDPSFPRPRKLGKRAVGWIASEVFAWVASRVAA